MLPANVRNGIRLFAVLWVASTVAFATARAQTGTVSGLVTAATNQRPLSGVQVYVTTMGNARTMTDANGRFALAGIPAGHYAIEAQRIGYRAVTQPVDVTAGGTATVNFALEERAISMEEVVVTGVAAETPQTQVPFTVAKIDVSSVGQAPALSLGGLVQGEVAGVKVVQGSGMPGTEPSFQFRGPKSISGSQSPLVVVDGVITTGGISDIDPADIQSIEIVKGASGAALYGSRAQAGVVEITTRSGAHLKSGQTQFTVRTTYESNSIEHYYGIAMHHQWMMDANQTAILDRKGNPITFPYRGTPALNDGGAGTNAFTTFMVNPYPSSITLQDPVKEFFNPGGRITNYVAVAGTEGRTDYRLSFDRTKEDGAIKLAEGLTQYNARLNVGQTFGKFHVDAGMYVAKRTRGLLDEGGTGTAVIRALTFTTAAANLLAIDTATGQVSAIGEPIYQGNVTTNPIYTLENTTFEEQRVRGMGSLDINWSPLKWLSIQGNGSFDRIDTDTSFYQRPGLIRPFQTPATGDIADRHGLRLELNGSLTAALTLQPMNDLTVRGRLRYLVESDDQNGFSIEGNNLPVGGVQQINLIGGTPSLNSYQQTIRSAGYFAIASITWAGATAVLCSARISAGRPTTASALRGACRRRSGSRSAGSPSSSPATRGARPAGGRASTRSIRRTRSALDRSCR
jgi:TonB-dependent SusC/RagA subfamily outer membrane receptor